MRNILIILALAFCASAGAQDLNVTKSPDGKMEAFTRGNDLWVRDLTDSLETRLTFDGSDLILGGYASWVYHEEFFGRASRYKAFWWSPDSRKLAYYRFDNTDVPMFPIYSPFGQGGKLSLTRYPKSGQSNPEVKVGVIDLASADKSTVWADFDETQDQYFGTPFWSADSKELYVSWMPRRQYQLELYAVNVADGLKRNVYSEKYKTWIEWIDGMIFTDKGLYMVRDFETDWQQIYFLSFDGDLTRLTDGENWGVTLLELNEKKGDLYFTAKRDSRLHTSLYKLDKKGRVTLLSDAQYNVGGVMIAEDFKSYTAMMSNARTPMFSVKGRTDKASWEVLYKMEADTANLPSPQIVKIENDGFDLYALMSLPKDFDPTKKYPVIMTLYGGPGTAYVRDTWGDRDASDKWCWENGIIHIVCDPRSSGENGRRGMDQAHKQMTVIELQDYIAWAKWLQSQSYVAGDRIGVQGFSFGGTTTSMLVLRYPQYFRCGVAGGGVYDWMLYDTHYTERFMDTPEFNEDGYKRASVLTYIPEIFSEDYKGQKPLPGALKITHGTGDDNVHFQNTLQLIDALQKVGYQFELMIYPDGMHGYRGAQSAHDKANDHMFWTKHLLED